eukprot:6197265-Pleurochrysis_carterae.AAC.1
MVNNADCANIGYDIMGYNLYLWNKEQKIYNKAANGASKISRTNLNDEEHQSNGTVLLERLHILGDAQDHACIRHPGRRRHETCAHA